MLLLDTKVKVNDLCTESHFVGLTGTVKENRSLCHPYVNRVEFDKKDEAGHWFSDSELDIIETEENFKMLTPCEIGRQIGRLQAKIHTEISEERIQHLAHILGIEEKIEFAEGYKNGFEEVRIEEREARIDETYRQMVEPEDSFAQPYTEFEGAGTDIPNRYCPDCGEALEEGHDCSLPWIPNPADLEAAEIEAAARELEQNQEAYREMVEDETAALKSPRYFSNAINPIQWNWW
jgi:hypothetical protein